MKFKANDKVVLNNLSDAVVYTVKNIDGFCVSLEYRAGSKMVSGGTIDICFLKKPTKDQLKNA